MARLEDGESRGWWRPIDRFPAGGIVGESSAILKREMIARWNWLKDVFMRDICINI